MSDRVAHVEAIAIGAELGQMAELWGGDMWDGDSGSAWPKPPGAWRSRPRYSNRIETTLVRLTTESGTVGYGECHAPIASPVHAEIVERLLAPIIVGEDPFATSVLWERMYAAMRLRGYDSGFYLEAISGVDIALWDVKGRLLDLPVHRLLGGSPAEPLRVYHSHLPAMRPERLAERASWLAQQGYTAVQLGGGRGVENDVSAVSAVRAAVGPEVQLMVDCAGSYDLAAAKILCRRLAEHGVWFVEDPLPHEHIRGYAALRADAPLAIATGEARCTRYQFLELLRADAVDIVLPDVGRSGGITETVRIANLADAFHVSYSPHISVGSTVYVAASLQVAAAMANLSIVEHWSGSHGLNDGIAETSPEFVAGWLTVPEGPGLGITVSDRAVERLRLT